MIPVSVRSAGDHDEEYLAELIVRFGPLTRIMLSETSLSAAWRLNFLANFFIGPIYKEIGERFDLSRPQFVILYSLLQTRDLVARDVCLATGLPKNSISRAVAELMERGLIARVVDDVDKRAKPLRPTPAGRDLVGAVEPLFLDRQTAMRAVLSNEEAAEFDRLLNKMIDAMPHWVEVE